MSKILQHLGEIISTDEFTSKEAIKYQPFGSQIPTSNICNKIIFLIFESPYPRQYHTFFSFIFFSIFLA